MNVLLFVLSLIVSIIVVRIGAIAFELTGLEWSLAKFQSLSCFTGTGFTTKEAELITTNTQRRQIASVLMVLGNASFVTLIATFADTLRPNSFMFSLPFMKWVFPPRVLPIANLIVISLVICILYKGLGNTKLARKLTNSLRKHIVKKKIIKSVSFEELLVATGGYGISSIEVCKNCPAVNMTLREADLRANDINILAIERNNEIIANPRPDTKIITADRLVCFGKLENIREKLYRPSDLKISESAELRRQKAAAKT